MSQKKRWEVLIVDDEKDVHMVTSLSVKRKVWRGRAINLTSAYSGKEAREILAAPDSPAFHVALVDVVMETEHAGLELCEWMREHVPMSLRIILRTGQPGVAPEDFVLNEYDIDQYLAKTEATAERLYASLRTSLRSSQDITALLKIGNQLRDFTNALQKSETATDDLVKIMAESISFLEEKHDISRILFVHNAADVLAGTIPEALQQSAEGLDLVGISNALLEVHKSDDTSLRPGESVGMAENTYIMPVKALETPERASEDVQKKGFGKKLGSIFKSMIGVADPETQRPDPVMGGFFVACPEALPPKGRLYLERDISLFAENWKIAFALMHLQESIVQERIAAIEAAERYGGHSG